MKKSIWVVYCDNEPQMEWFDQKEDAVKFWKSANKFGNEARYPLSILIPVIMPNEIGDLLESLEYARDEHDDCARYVQTEDERHSLRKRSMAAEKAARYVRAYQNDMWGKGKQSVPSREPR